MSSTEARKCAHPICTCEVKDGKKYCSNACESAGKTEIEIACDCGHSSCHHVT